MIYLIQETWRCWAKRDGVEDSWRCWAVTVLRFC